MANVLYDSGKFRFLSPGTLGPTSGDAIDMASDNFQVVLVTAGYTFAQAGGFLDPVIAGGNRVATSGNLASLSVSAAGAFDAADVTFSAVSGSQVTQVVLFKATGTETTSPLIVYWDTMTGLPVTPNGGDITIAWDASGIFAL
jgi:starvation-inducible outer membrane lipoprotein